MHKYVKKDKRLFYKKNEKYFGTSQRKIDTNSQKTDQ